MVQKREWAIPQTFVQQFAANEYVAACWKINCNVPYGFGFIDNNGNKKYDFGQDTYLAKGSGCGEYHIGVQSDSGPVDNAMWQPLNLWGTNDGDAYPVFYFSTGKGNNDQHFSKCADAEWDTNPNAS